MCKTSDKSCFLDERNDRVKDQSSEPKGHRVQWTGLKDFVKWYETFFLRLDSHKNHKRTHDTTLNIICCQLSCSTNLTASESLTQNGKPHLGLKALVCGDET